MTSSKAGSTLLPSAGDDAAAERGLMEAWAGAGAGAGSCRACSRAAGVDSSAVKTSRWNLDLQVPAEMDRVGGSRGWVDWVGWVSGFAGACRDGGWIGWGGQKGGVDRMSG